MNDLPPISNPTSENGVLQLDLFMKLYEKNNAYYAILLGENGDPAFASRLKQAVKPMIGETFLLHNVAPLEVNYISEFILSAMIGIMGYWFRENRSLPADRLIALVYDLMEGKVMGRFKHVIGADPLTENHSAV